LCYIAEVVFIVKFLFKFRCSHSRTYRCCIIIKLDAIKNVTKSKCLAFILSNIKIKRATYPYIFFCYKFSLKGFSHSFESFNLSLPALHNIPRMQKNAILELKIIPIENIQISSTDQRHLVIKFRFPLGKHKVVTYTALAARSTGCGSRTVAKRFLKM